MRPEGGCLGGKGVILSLDQCIIFKLVGKKKANNPSNRFRERQKRAHTHRTNATASGRRAGLLERPRVHMLLCSLWIRAKDGASGARSSPALSTVHQCRAPDPTASSQAQGAEMEGMRRGEGGGVGTGWGMEGVPGQDWGDGGGGRMGWRRGCGGQPGSGGVGTACGRMCPDASRLGGPA